MSTTGWMVAAFTAAAAGIGGYVASLFVRRRRLLERLRRLRG